MMVIHTREGHSPDLADCPPTKIVRGRGAKRIGDPGPMGRILVRGEHGHDIVPELAPQAGEVVIDKPGKGAFCATDLDLILHNRGIKSLIVCGVTTEVCVNTTVREANDRGYECVVLADCVGSYFPEFQRVALEMIKAQGGIFGWVSDSRRALAALQRLSHATHAAPVRSHASASGSGRAAGAPGCPRISTTQVTREHARSRARPSATRPSRAARRGSARRTRAPRRRRPTRPRGASCCR